MRFGCEAKSTHIRSFCLAYRSAIDQSHLSILVSLPDLKTCRDLTDRLPEKSFAASYWFRAFKGATFHS